MSRASSALSISKLEAISSSGLSLGASSPEPIVACFAARARRRIRDNARAPRGRSRLTPSAAARGRVRSRGNSRVAAIRSARAFERYERAQLSRLAKTVWLPLGSIRAQISAGEFCSALTTSSSSSATLISSISLTSVLQASATSVAENSAGSSVVFALQYPAYIRKTPKRVGSIGAFSVRRKRQRQRTPPRLRGGDDAVVPQPRGRVIRRALRFVFRADRRLERLLLLRRPVLPSASSASRRSVASTLAACSPPITLMRAFGQVNRKRGP